MEPGPDFLLDARFQLLCLGRGDLFMCPAGAIDFPSLESRFFHLGVGEQASSFSKYSKRKAETWILNSDKICNGSSFLLSSF